MYERAKYCLEDHLYGRLHDFLKWYGGGLFSEQVDLARVRSVLDVACGSGEWVLDMAFQYPHIQFVGLDGDASRIGYARAHARVLGLENVSFVVSGIRQMKLPSGYYDLVHGRFLSAVMSPSTERALCAEMLRVCTVRGRVILRELLYPTTNSAACQCWCELLRQLARRMERLVGMANKLDSALYGAGCRKVHGITHKIDIAHATPAHRALCAKAWEVMEFTKPFFSHYQIVSGGQFERLCAEVMIELDAETFRGEWPLVTFVGRK
ncbi:MAG: class I SAM-dependent methyltransferase [Ktedonobacteraceae bacterium]|nr:class I SAM-dependent methyltransferase [Ktedonobacteraceae bacterium]